MKKLITAACISAAAVIFGIEASGATVTVHVGPSSNFMSFSPASVSIAVGDTVQWIWDSSPHSVTSGTFPNASGLFDSGSGHSAGFIFSHTFTAAGSIPYYCSVHGAAMTGSIAVGSPTPTPRPSATPTPTATATATATPTAAPTPSVPRVQKGSVRVELQTIASGLTAPIDFVAAKDGTQRQFIVQQTGQIRVLKNGQLLPTPFLDVSSRLVPLSARYDERGLLGVAFHPAFTDATNPGVGKLYTFTNEPVAGTADFTVPMTGAFNNQIVIAEWQVSAANPDLVDVSTRREILRINHPQSNHNGGQLAFGPNERYLYFSIGDGGAANDVGDGHTPTRGNGQDTINVLGKILRIDPIDPARTAGSADPISANGKYRIPVSNPFVVSAGVAERVREIFAFGLRNPFRFSFDPVSGNLIAADVGQDHIEEIDLIASGKNYGWNKKEGTFLFNPATGGNSIDPAPDPALTNPLAQYSHDDGIAVIGGFVYHGSGVPALAGKYVFGDLSGNATTNGGRLFVLDDLSSGMIRELQIGIDDRRLGLFLKAFGRDAAGEIYLLVDSAIGPTGTGGRLLKIVSAPAAPAFVNLSTRMKVLSGENVLIGGFIVVGSAPQPVVLRGIGPSISVNGQPVGGTMQNPSLELHDASGKLLDSNDDWQTNPQKQEFISRNLAPTDPRESALFGVLQPGAYTAILSGASGDTGIALLELYDADQTASANPVNVATRGFVQGGNDVMIGGFIVGGSTAQNILLRAIGPSLAAAGVKAALQDPTLELHDANGVLLRANDNWRTSQQTEIAATGIAPTDDRESAILASLTPGVYTAIVRGANDAVGVALVEAYQLAH